MANLSKLNINQTELLYTPRKEILSKLTNLPDGEPEMSEFESAFLCGMLKEKHPKKILEIGVAGGASTAIILQCIEDLYTVDEEVSLHSIDYCKQFYVDPSKKSGYIAEDAKEFLKPETAARHHVYLGDIACNFLETIGGYVDFVILDTVHVLPGELLDIATIMPYLSDDCIVVMHDVALQFQIGKNLSTSYATGLSLAAISGEKYICEDDSRPSGYPNIAAFKITDTTRNNIENIIQALTLPWSYIPDNEQLSKYRKRLSKLYPEEYLWIFDKASQLNIERLSKKDGPLGHYLFPFVKIPQGSKIIIYGAGKVGVSYAVQAIETGYCDVIKWVDQNYSAFSHGIMSITPPESILDVSYDTILIANESEATANKIKDFLVNMGVDASKIMWHEPWV